uniref:Uncharacterized protein n=1 Tax=Pithovirus LCPAC403 TaxID=2506596 RepID=A0A481ZCV0_9VIRU|nr:MAG: hypothetical protein LCPAC403_00130 [Pithovirus LCPAC403]
MLSLILIVLVGKAYGVNVFEAQTRATDGVQEAFNTGDPSKFVNAVHPDFLLTGDCISDYVAPELSGCFPSAINSSFFIGGNLFLFSTIANFSLGITFTTDAEPFIKYDGSSAFGIMTTVFTELDTEKEWTTVQWVLITTKLHEDVWKVDSWFTSRDTLFEQNLFCRYLGACNITQLPPP